jgi:hypothetical protein
MEIHRSLLEISQRVYSLEVPSNQRFRPLDLCCLNHTYCLILEERLEHTYFSSSIYYGVGNKDEADNIRRNPNHQRIFYRCEKYHLRDYEGHSG